jgi:hypothetical protein
MGILPEIPETGICNPKPGKGRCQENFEPPQEISEVDII